VEKEDKGQRAAATAHPVEPSRKKAGVKLQGKRRGEIKNLNPRALSPP